MSSIPGNGRVIGEWERYAFAKPVMLQDDKLRNRVEALANYRTIRKGNLPAFRQLSRSPMTSQEA